MNVRQIVPVNDTGLLKNASEFLREVRNKNVEAVLLTYLRKDDGYTQTYIFNRQNAKFNLILDIANMFKNDESTYYPDSEKEGE